MRMPPYPICCYGPTCGKLAVYKIAARWSDGVTQELKTYALTCADCLNDWFRRSRAKQAACRLAPGETLEPPGIYTLERGRRDAQINRVREMEAQLAGDVHLTDAIQPPPRQSPLADPGSKS